MNNCGIPACAGMTKSIWLIYEQGDKKGKWKLVPNGKDKMGWNKRPIKYGDI
jgi:hypothetical protein